jgi:hypothetical protein
MLPQAKIDGAKSLPSPAPKEIGTHQRGRRAMRAAEGIVRRRTKPDGYATDPISGVGGAEGDRTPDLRNAIATLSQLSYGPTSFRALGELSRAGKAENAQRRGEIKQALALVVLTRGLDAKVVVARFQIDFLVRADFRVLVDGEILSL